MYFKEDFDSEDESEVSVEEVDEGGVEYTENKLLEISDLAKTKLDVFENSDSKEREEFGKNQPI